MLSLKTGNPLAEKIIPYVSPFGSVFVNMLKMIVIPVVFFSLILGAASLPVKKFGRVGIKVIGWYLFTSLVAAAFGVMIGLAINPGSGGALSDWQKMVGALKTEAAELAGKAAERTFTDIFLGMFRNPFESLANGNYLALIVFAILFGLAIRVTMEASSDEKQKGRLLALIDFFEAVKDAVFKLIDWIMEYAPIGVFALSIVNFGLYGHSIVGPYVSVVSGVILGILAMIFLVYSALLFVFTGENPFKVLRKIREPMLTAFVTRSSAATLPVSIKTANTKLNIKEELTGFSLPLGATINMDGVCIHLPMFAVLAANMFGINLTLPMLFVLVVTTVLASIGAGGVPGGSLMLMFMILQIMGLSGEQVAVIVALALGVNPILDMFETMNNVTGDLICTYVVAKKEGLINQPKS